MKNTSLFVQELENYQIQYCYGKAKVKTIFVWVFGFRNLFKIYPGDDKFNIFAFLFFHVHVGIKIFLKYLD